MRNPKKHKGITQVQEVNAIVSEIVEKLKKEYDPLRIILFGSYAYGNPTKESDIDLFILKKTHERRADRFVQVKRIIYDSHRTMCVSPLVYTPDEMEERLRIGDDFIKEIIKKGVVLYEKTSS
ncbi:MAG: nucleotidyltransferase domain-containing protein [Theionarchaea archaeon]|nr:nucleotidyltransferase domain-containing protein [Theionarchaea archaeon]